MLDQLYAPAVNDEVPVTAKVPVCEIAPPLLVAESVPPTVLAPNDNAPVLMVVRFPPIVAEVIVSAPAVVRATLFAPELDNVTAPTKLLVPVVSVMALALVVKLVVPSTTRAPVWVIALEVTIKLPPTVNAGKAIALA